MQSRANHFIETGGGVGIKPCGLFLIFSITVLLFFAALMSAISPTPAAAGEAGQPAGDPTPAAAGEAGQPAGDQTPAAATAAATTATGDASLLAGVPQLTAQDTEDAIEIDAVPLVVGTPQNVTLDDEAGHEGWFSFSPETNGGYRFFSSDREDGGSEYGSGDPRGYLYEYAPDDPDADSRGLVFLDENDDSEYPHFEIMRKGLQAGELYYLKCTDLSDSSCSYAVTVEKLDEYDFSLASVENVSSNMYYRGKPIVVNPDVIDAAGQPVSPEEYTMTLQKWDDEAYDYAIADAIDGPGEYQLLIEANEQSDYHGTITRPIWVDQYVWSFGDSYADVPTKLSGVISPGKAQHVAIEESDEYEWYAFTPSADGYYTIALNNAENYPRVQLYGPVDDEIASETDFALYSMTRMYYDDGEDKATVQMDSGSTYYFACGSYYSDTALDLLVAPYDEKNLANCSVDAKSSFWIDEEVSARALDFDVHSVNAEGDYVESLELDTDFELEGWYDKDGAKLDAAPEAVGTYYAAITGKEPYHGMRKVEFEIRDQYDLGAQCWSLYVNDIYEGTVVDGQSLNPRFSFDYNLSMPKPVLGEDYRIARWLDSNDNELSAAPTAAGTYSVEFEATGESDYHGTRSCTFAIIDSKKLTNWSAQKSSGVFWATGSAVSLERLGVTFEAYGASDAVLEFGKDYKFAGWYDSDETLIGSDPEKGPADVGSYYACFEGLDPYTGTVFVDFAIEEYQWTYNQDAAIAPSGDVEALDTKSSRKIVLPSDDEADVCWFSFTPEMDSTYRFFSNLESGDPRAVLYEAQDADEDGCNLACIDRDDDGFKENNFLIEADLKAGKTYYLACGVYGSSGSYEVNVKNRDEHDLSQLSTYVDYYPSEGEDYTFESLGIDVRDLDGNGYLVAGTDFEFEGWYQDGEKLVAAPKAAGTYAARIVGVNPYHGMQDIEFQIIALTDLDNASVLDVDGSYMLRDKPITIEPRVVDRSGDTIDPSKITITLRKYDSDDDEFVSIGTGTSFQIDEVGEYNLLVKPSGDEYVGSTSMWFSVANYYWSYGDDYADLPNGDIESIGEGAPVHVEFTEGTPVAWFAFKPVVDGDYVFTSGKNSNDPVAGFYEPVPAGDPNEDGYALKEIESDDDGGDSYNFELKARGLKAGQTYYLVCKDLSDENAQFDVTVVKYDPKNLAYCDLSSRWRFWMGEEISASTLNLQAYIPADDGGEGIELEYGTDFEFDGFYDWEGNKLGGVPSDAGIYYVQVKGNNPYTGTARTSFRLWDQYDLGNYWGLSANNIFVGTAATAQSLNLSLWSEYDDELEGLSPVIGQDFEISGWFRNGARLKKAPSLPGSYKVEVEGIGSLYHGTLQASFQILDGRDLGNYEASSKSVLWSYGEPVTLDRMGVKIFPEGQPDAELTYGSDYVFSCWYDEDDNPLGTDPNAGPAQEGYYSARFEGRGDFADTERRVSFEVRDAYSLSNYTGDVNEAIELDSPPLTVETLGLQVYAYDENASLIELQYGKDYQVTGWQRWDESYFDDSSGAELLDQGTDLADISEVGIYTITLEGIAPYTGLLEKAFEITEVADPIGDDLQAAVDAAKKTRDKLESKVAEDKQALDEAQTAYDAALADKAAVDEALASKKDALQSAQNDLSSAQQALQASKDEKAAATSGLSSASDAVDAAQSDVTAAQAEADAAQAAVTAAEAKVANAQAALSAAQAQIAKGSFGFFEQVGATAALNALNRTGKNNLGETLKTTDSDGKLFTSYTHQGEETDATSLENMKNSIQWMRRANELRAAEDKLTACNNVPLKVSDTLMAMAQSNANWSDSHIGHADNNGGNFNVGENVAWNYGSDPFLQWYDREKEVYHNEDFNGDGIIGDGNSKQTGHYLNVVDASHQSTGFAISTRGSKYPYTFGQTFSGSSYNGEPTYTVDEYEARFMEYYNSVKGEPEQALADAEAELAAAKSTAAAKAAALTQAQENLAAAQTQKTAAESRLEAAEQAVTSNEGAVASAQDAVDAAQADVDSAQAAADSAAQVVEQKQALLAQAQNTYDNDSAKLEVANQAYEQAKSNLSHSLAYASVSEPQERTYSGGELGLSAIVTAHDGTVLIEGVDYVVEYEDNVDVGQATATISGIKPYTGTLTATFDIVEASIADAALANIPAKTYDGRSYLPEPKLSFAGKQLVKGTDYKIVSYSKTTNAGTATVTVEGQGNFADQRVIEYTIEKAVLTATYAGQTIAFDGKPDYSLVDVTGWVNGENETTARGYEKPAIAPLDQSKLVPGATLELTPAGGKADNYKFSYKSGKLVIGAKPAEGGGDDNGGSDEPGGGSGGSGGENGNGGGNSGGSAPKTVAIKTVTAANAVYSNAAKLPAPKFTVKDANGKVVPASGYTYEVAYNKGYGKQPAKDGKYVGIAKVTVKGKGSYTGTKTASFKITTVADTKTIGAKLTEKTLGAIEKLKSGANKVQQANSKTMETIAKPRAKTMTVRWKAVKGATNYVVGYKRSTAKAWSYEMSGGKLEHTFKNMTEGDLMEFRVAVYNGKKFARSEWTQINCRFYREMVSLKAAVGKGRVDMSWGKVAGATGYQVLVATKKDMSDAQVVDVKGGSTLKATIKAFKGKALKSGKTYYIKMRSFKEATNALGKPNKYIGIQSLVRTCKEK